MDRVYFLSTCNTCNRILKELPRNKILQIDIKKQPLSESEIDILGQLVGTYQALFNKQAVLYKKLELKNKLLQESDFRSFLLAHYTFLRRPVFVIGNEIFIGSKPETIARIKEILN